MRSSFSFFLFRVCGVGGGCRLIGVKYGMNSGKGSEPSRASEAGRLEYRLLLVGRVSRSEKQRNGTDFKLLSKQTFVSLFFFKRVSLR